MTNGRWRRLFQQKTVYISGGSSGIGFACAELLAPCVAQLVLIARDVSRLQEAEDTLSQRNDCNAEIHTISVDVSDTHRMESSLAEALRRTGPPHVVIHSAGYAFPAPFESFDQEKMKQIFDINVIGTWNMIRCLTPALRSGAVIASISSFAALLGVYGYSAYTASKCAVFGLCEALRNELLPQGIAMKVVCPADVDTPQLAYENQHKPPQTKAISGMVRPYSAKYVAEYILARIYRRRFLIIPGFYPKIIWLMKRIWPSFVYRIVDRALMRHNAS